MIKCGLECIVNSWFYMGLVGNSLSMGFGWVRAGDETPEVIAFENQRRVELGVHEEEWSQKVPWVSGPKCV